ncbi:hypothetical protein FH972_002786 [Carpinus fangiana]|uniref:Root meristem growth factor 9 n=1 Tax=Carpinus fangiana TaxID=176857 RepID=A0A5N6QIB5_9ROSI|nr:hypothetical protein FH972_002786 [Carpinus fangiana]
MAICKRLLLLAFLLLCFISITATARNLPRASNEAPKGYVDQITPNQDHEVLDSDELVSMDYTPTKKNPPIHN